MFFFPEATIKVYTWIFFCSHYKSLYLGFLKVYTYLCISSEATIKVYTWIFFSVATIKVRAPPLDPPLSVMEVISLPTWLWLDCTWRWYSHIGDVQPRASSKVLDIVKCFCKSTTLYITKRCRLRKQGCPCMVHFRAPVHRCVLITVKWL